MKKSREEKDREYEEKEKDGEVALDPADWESGPVKRLSCTTMTGRFLCVVDPYEVARLCNGGSAVSMTNLSMFFAQYPGFDRTQFDKEAEGG